MREYSCVAREGVERHILWIREYMCVALTENHMENLEELCPEIETQHKINSIAYLEVLCLTVLSFGLFFFKKLLLKSYYVMHIL